MKGIIKSLISLLACFFLIAVCPTVEGPVFCTSQLDLLNSGEQREHRAGQRGASFDKAVLQLPLAQHQQNTHSELHSDGRQCRPHHAGGDFENLEDVDQGKDRGKPTVQHGTHQCRAQGLYRGDTAGHIAGAIALEELRGHGEHAGEGRCGKAKGDLLGDAGVVNRFEDIQQIDAERH